jgi:hypothetical protein
LQLRKTQHVSVATYKTLFVCEYMHETYWVAYVGIFFVPFCAVAFLIYLYDRKHRAKSSLLVEVVVAQVVPETSEEHAASAPELAEIEATATKNERPPPPAYRESAHNTPAVQPLYPNPHAASAARMQMPRIYIHAVGLR